MIHKAPITVIAMLRLSFDWLSIKKMLQGMQIQSYIIRVSCFIYGINYRSGNHESD